MTRRPSWPPFCLVGVLALALGYLAADARGRVDHYRKVSSIQLQTERTRPAAGLDGGAIPGSRDQILSLSGSDGYQWVVHAEEMRARGAWRVHRTEIDNAPKGREVHWSSSPLWWLLLLGSIGSAFGVPAAEAIGRAALWAGPIQYACLLVFLSLLVYRRLGWAAACVLPAAVLLAPRLAEFFQAGYMDHHGLASIAGLAAALFAAAAGAGWVRSEPGDETSARRWMRASAIAGAAGLWISSASTVPVLVGIGLGALLAARGFGRRQTTTASWHPALWRQWGRVGAAASLGFYLIEYFPSSMGMRLEVNHPLYALAWLGAGELLFRGCRRLGGGRLIDGPGDRLAIPAAAVAVTLLPLLIVIAPDQFFWVSNRFLWTLHRDIGEFHPLASMFRQYGLETTLRANSLLPLLGFPAAIALCRPGLDPRAKGMLAVTLLPALFLGTLALIQVRWAGNQEALWLGVLAVGVSLLTDPRTGRPGLMTGATVAFLGLAVVSAWPATLGSTLKSRRPNFQVTIDDQLQLVMRSVAHQIRRRSGESPVVVLTGPSATTEMIYFGGLRGLGTLYWENRDGLEAAASIYGAATDDDALARIREHQVTHLVSFSWEDYSEKLALLDRENFPEAQSGATFAQRLKSSLTLPVWVRPVPYAIPTELGLKGQEVVILEVHPEQTSAEQLAYVGDYFLQSGDPTAAQATYRRALTAEAGQPRAAVGLAKTLVRSGDATVALQALQSTPGNTSPEERADLATEVARLGGQVSATDPALAIRFYRRALIFDPRCRLAWNNLAWMLATSPDPAVRDGAEATRAAQALVALDAEPDPISLDTLAAAYAEAGRWAEAVATAVRAVELAGQRDLKDQVDFRARLELYRSGRPYHQTTRRG